MGKSNKRLLVHKEMEDREEKKNIDIILSPEFYTFLKEELGIKFAYQAKQIAPSLFDDYLDNSSKYQYFVYKFDNYWNFFAYDMEEITQFLEAKGVKKYQIGKIFFAQEFYSHLDTAMELGEKSALLNIDEVTTVIPKKLLGHDYTYKELNLKKLPLKNSVSISSSLGSLIPLKQTLILTSLLIILGAIFVVESERIKSSISEDKARLEQLLDENPKLASARIRESILSQYEPIDREERKKRDIIEKISKLLSKRTQLKELILDDKKVSALIESNNINKILRDAKNMGFKVKKEGAKRIRVERYL